MVTVGNLMTVPTHRSPKRRAIRACLAVRLCSGYVEKVSLVWSMRVKRDLHPRNSGRNKANNFELKLSLSLTRQSVLRRACSSREGKNTKKLKPKAPVVLFLQNNKSPGAAKNAKYPGYLFLAQSAKRRMRRPFYLYRSLRKQDRIGG